MYSERAIIVNRRIIGFNLQTYLKGHWEDFFIGFTNIDFAIETMEYLLFAYPRNKYRIYSAVDSLVVYE